MRSVARDPNERFATAADFSAALAGEPVAPPKSAPAAAKPASPAKPSAAPSPAPADATAVVAKAKGCFGVLIASALLGSMLIGAALRL